MWEEDRASFAERFPTRTEVSTRGTVDRLDHDKLVRLTGEEPVAVGLDDCDPLLIGTSGHPHRTLAR